MDSNKTSGVKPGMTFDDALSFGDHEFLMRHPRETWPEGLAACVVRGGSRNNDGHWVVSYTAAVKEPLKPGEYWDTINGNQVLCKTDPKTGAKRVIIHRRASTPPLVLFQVLIEPANGKTTVLVDQDLSSLNVAELERC